MNTNLKIKRIKTLIERLESGKNISLNSMARVIPHSALDKFKKDWEVERQPKKIVKPKAISKYENLIKIACFLYSKMEEYRLSLDKGHLANKFALKADLAFENALEFLKEQIQTESSSRMWIDRDLKDAEFDPFSIPRVIGSSSPECRVKRKTPYPTLSKKELKLRVLELALSELEPPVLEEFCETEKIIHFSPTKRREIDVSSFKF
jgi:hypothetical protein